MKLNCTLLFQFFNFLILYWILRSLLLKKLLQLFFKERDNKNRAKNQLKELEIQSKLLIKDEEHLYANFHKKIKEKENHIAQQKSSPLQLEPINIDDQIFSDLELKEITNKIQEKIEKECSNAN